MIHEITIGNGHSAIQACESQQDQDVCIVNVNKLGFAARSPEGDIYSSLSVPNGSRRKPREGLLTVTGQWGMALIWKTVCLDQVQERNSCM